jgi:FkbM family methyltransferase
VLDCGANIGLFSLWALPQIAPGGVIVAYEPAPAVAAACRANLSSARYDVDVRVRELALAEKSGTSRLRVYPRISGWSSLEPDEAETLSNLQAYVKNRAGDALGALSPPLRLLAPLARLLAPLRRACLSLAMRFLVAGAADVAVQTTSLSDSLCAEGLSQRRIALLKIDVERGELAVLQGVAAHDWPFVDGVAVEVHDLDGRLQRVTQLLRDAGFEDVRCEQDARLEGSRLRMVYASRARAATS